MGDAVGYTGLPPGAYAEQRNWPAERTLKLPAGISAEIAASSMLKGLTAWYLLRRSYRLQAGESVLLYAAAGGTGTILAQWAKALGAKVIGVVSSPAKAELARANGCAETILSNEPDFVAKVKSLSGGGVAVAYDSIGKDTFMQSLDCLRRHGTMVSFGNASGPVEPFSPMELVKRGSLHLTRPSLFDFIASKADLDAGADRTVRRDQQRRGEDRHRPALRIAGCCAGTPRPGKPQDHRRHTAAPLKGVRFISRHFHAFPGVINDDNGVYPCDLYQIFARLSHGQATSLAVAGVSTPYRAAWP